MPSADAPPSVPVHVTVPSDKADFGFVLNQDLGVIRTIQSGLHQPGLTHLVLSAEELPHHQHAPPPRALPRPNPRRHQAGTRPLILSYQ